MAKSTKDMTLDELIKNMNKSAGAEIVTKGLSDYNYTRIPFTSPRMNWCTYGGLPEGRIIEFFGEEHGGKTTTALDSIANFQQMYPDRKVLYVDAENTLDVEWAHKLGVNTDENFILFQPQSQSAEVIFDFIVDAVSTGEIGFWVLDSIGVLFSDAEWEKSIQDKTYGGISKPLTTFSKKVEQAMHGHKCTGIGINQIREKIGSMYGGTTTPGGNGWRHMCSVRIEFRKGKYYDEKGTEISRGTENPAGNIVNVDMPKNKTCPPKRHITSYSINYDIGVDYIKDLVEMCIEVGYIEKSGAWFEILNPETGEVACEKIQGQNNVAEYVAENEEIMQMLENGLENIINDL